jgi:hypothetical protein
VRSGARRPAGVPVAVGVLAVVAAGLLAGCASTPPLSEPVLRPGGEHVMLYESAEIRLAVAYRYAAGNLGEEWLLLEMGAMGADHQTPVLSRNNMYVIAPSGRRIPMATQREYLEGFASETVKLRRADIVRNPLTYFPMRARPCLLRFFTDNRRWYTVYDRVTLTDRQACRGRLFFHVPGGVQKGRWVLVIELEEETVRVPFLI